MERTHKKKMRKPSKREASMIAVAGLAILGGITAAYKLLLEEPELCDPVAKTRKAVKDDFERPQPPSSAVTPEPAAAGAGGDDPPEDEESSIPDQNNQLSPNNGESEQSITEEEGEITEEDVKRKLSKEEIGLRVEELLRYLNSYLSGARAERGRKKLSFEEIIEYQMGSIWLNDLTHAEKTDILVKAKRMIDKKRQEYISQNPVGRKKGSYQINEAIKIYERELNKLQEAEKVMEKFLR